MTAPETLDLDLDTEGELGPDALAIIAELLIDLAIEREGSV